MDEGYSLAEALRMVGVHWCVTTRVPTPQPPTRLEVLSKNFITGKVRIKIDEDEPQTVHPDIAPGTTIIAFDNFWQAYACNLRMQQEKKGESK